MNNLKLTHPKYRPDIDGLRAIAVLSVVGFHAFPFWIKAGFVGVDIFFVISGYLISTIIYENLVRKSFSMVEFYNRRIKRIFPALILVLLSSFIFGWFVLLPDEYSHLGKHMAAGTGFISNWVLWSESGYFDNAADTKPLLHLWSLGIEEQFYLIWPFFIWVTWKWRLNLLSITISIAIISFIWNIYQIETDPVATFYLPQTRFWELLIGSYLAYFTLFKKPLLTSFFQRGGLNNYNYSNLKSFIGAIMIGVGILFTKEQSFPGWWAILPTIGTALIISAGPKTWVNRVILSNGILVRLGLISFPLYLWHWPLLSYARIINGGLPSTKLRILLVITSILAAWLTYKFIEKPIRFGLKNRYSVLTLTSLALILGIVGFGSYSYEGYNSLRNIENFTMNSKVAEQLVGPGWKYSTNKTCLTQYPFKESIGFCIKNADDKPDVLLLGNSHANQLYPGFTINTKLKNHSVLSIGSCDPVMDDNLDKNGVCYGDRQLQQQKFINEIVSTSKSVKFVVIDGLSRQPSTEYISLLQKRIAFFESNGAKVIVFTPHLRLEFDPKNCFTRPLRSTSKNCTLPLQVRDEYLAQFKPLMVSIARTNPKTLFFEQNGMYCDTKQCGFIKDGMPLERDFKHLSEFGSIELAKHFVAWTEVNTPELLINN